MILIISTIERFKFEIGLFPGVEYPVACCGGESPLETNSSGRNTPSALPRGSLYDKKLEIFKFETKNQSDDLLPSIEKTLKCQKISLQDIDKILVNIGLGSYTGVRVGVTTANALAWSLDIPVFAFKEGDLEKTLAEIEKSTTKKFTKPVLPYYNN